MVWRRISIDTAAIVGVLALAGLGDPAGGAAVSAQTLGSVGLDAAQLDQGRGGRGGGRGGQIRDNQPQPVGTSAIEGGVFSDTGSPVRRARVTLSGGGLRGGRSTVTDDQGAFEFLALPAGLYNMTASKAGYVDNAYGARSPGRPGTPIQLAESQTIEKAFITLPKGGVLTGMVIDDYGEPAPGTQVRALRFVMRSGERTAQQAGVDQTDDRGIYRIYGLQPGEYMVSAVPRNQNISNLREAVMAEVEALLGQAGRGGRAIGALTQAGGQNQALLTRAAALQEQLQAQVDEQAVAYAPVYYPGTPSPSSAQSVMLDVGEERIGVDLQLQLVPTARVAGTVSSLDGVLPQGTQVVLVPADLGGLRRLPGLGNETARVNQDGQFSFANVTPGQYTLQARGIVREVDPTAEPETAARGRGRGGFGGRGGRGGPIAQVLWASMNLAVSGTNLEGLVLTLAPGMQVSGQIEFDGMTAQPPDDLTAMRVSLAPRGEQVFNIGGLPPAEVDEMGRFTIKGVAPGHYSVNANVGRGGRGGGGGGTIGQWSLKSAQVGSVEALDFPFAVAPNQNIDGMRLIFGDQTQELSGMLQDASGMPVADFTIILFPTDERYWLPLSRRIASARPDTEGRFRFRGLPEGDYRLTAITDAEPGEWYNPSFLEQLVSSSIPLSLSRGERKVQDIRLAGGGHRP